MKTEMLCQSNGSDKVYAVEIRPRPDQLFDVVGIYGPRLGGRKEHVKATGVTLAEANRKHGEIVRDQLKKQYVITNTAVDVPPVTAPAKPQGDEPDIAFKDLPDHMLLTPVIDPEPFLADSSYMLQPKLDGVRLRVVKLPNGKTYGTSRQGNQRALPEPIAKILRSMPQETLVLDGEQVEERFYCFDVLTANGMLAWRTGAATRMEWVRTAFEKRGQGYVIPVVTAERSDQKRKLFDACYKQGHEGVVFKASRVPYAGGRGLIGIKFKFTQTASVICGGQRQETSKRTGDAKRSVTMLLADGSVLGSLTIPPNKEIPAKGAILEVRYLYKYPNGGDIIQAVYERERDDVEAPGCTADQFHVKGQPR